MSSCEEAAEKLRRECGAGKFGQKEEAMKEAVLAALTEFCRQSDRFCRKVLEGRSFEECMKTVAKGVGGSISDLEAFKRAVRYYWKGADVRFRMEITEGNVNEEDGPSRTPAPTGEGPAEATKIFDLEDFL